MTKFVFNGVEMDEEEFEKALFDSQEYMREEERRIQRQYDVSLDTASAIKYLRGRSRWTLEKEQELIDRDKAGNPISLGEVLSGKF